MVIFAAIGYFILKDTLNAYDQPIIILMILECLFYILIILLPNLFLFLVLRKRLEMEIDTFLYGIAFVGNIVSFVLYMDLLVSIANMLTQPTESIGRVSLILIALLFASLFYAYAAALKKGSGKIALLLLMMTIVFFAALIIENFEIIKQYFETFELNYKFLQSIIVSPILLGLYAGYYAVYRTVRISLRNAAWASFLVTYVMIFGTIWITIISIVMAQLIMMTRLSTHSIHYLIPAEIYYDFPGGFNFLISFAIAYLAGKVCKSLKKNPNQIQMSECKKGEKETDE